MANQLSFRWLGVAGIELTLGGHILTIDPFFTRPPFRCLWAGRVEPDRETIHQHIQACNEILVSHAHYDHLMDVPEVMRQTGADAYGSENTCQLLARLGAPPGKIHRITAGGKLACGPFQVEVLPAKHIRLLGFSPGPLRKNLHPPLRLWDYRMDHSWCFLLQADGLRVLVWTSERVEPSPPADVLFLGLTRQKDYTEALLSRVRPRVVIPIHWDDFFRPLTKPIKPSFAPPRLVFPPLQRMDLTQFKHLVEKISPGIRVVIPQRFHAYKAHEILAQHPSVN